MRTEQPNRDAAGLLSTTEAAQALGVTRQTVNRWIDENRIAHALVGRRYRIPVSEVDRMLAIQPVQSDRAAS